MEKKTNRGLKEKYDAVYKGGKEKFFTFSSNIVTDEVVKEIDWKGKSVLEIGCGTGETAIAIAERGAKVLAVDYAKEAIAIAKEKHKHPNLTFEVKDLKDITGTYDVVVMQETLEHTDDPFKVLGELKKRIKKDGTIIVTCPNFTNVRGYIWMSLQILLEVPMSLSDLQFICPFDVQKWADKLGMKLKWRTIETDRGNGDRMIVDMRKRLTNALRDAKLDNTKVEKLMEWLSEVAKYDHSLPFSGATGIYKLTY